MDTADFNFDRNVDKLKLKNKYKSKTNILSKKIENGDYSMSKMAKLDKQKLLNSLKKNSALGAQGALGGAVGGMAIPNEDSLGKRARNGALMGIPAGIIGGRGDTVNPALLGMTAGMTSSGASALEQKRKSKKQEKKASEIIDEMFEKKASLRIESVGITTTASELLETLVLEKIASINVPTEEEKEKTKNVGTEDDEISEEVSDEEENTEEESVDEGGENNEEE